MRLAKLFVLAVVALLIVVAASVASTASADVLCEDKPQVAEEVEACVAPYPEKSELKASSKKVVLSSSVKATCESSITVNTEKNLGEAKGLQGTIESLTFTNCTGCTGVTAVNLPYKATATASGEGNGSVKVTAISGNPGLKLTGCPLGIVCEFGSAELAFAFKGGEPALIEAKGIAVERTGGSALCGTTGTLEGAYELQQPNGGKARLAKAMAGIEVSPLPYHFPAAGMETLKVKNPAGSVAWTIQGFLLVSGEYSFTDPAPPNQCAGKRLLATQKCDITIRCLVSPAGNANLIVHTTFITATDPLSCG